MPSDEAAPHTDPEAPAISPVAITALAGALEQEVGARQFYLFWFSGGSGQRSSAPRQRTLLAFRTPDSALVFAQRNRLSHEGESPRVRRLTLTQIIQATIHERKIAAVLLVAEDDPETPPGQLPAGTRLERADLFQRLIDLQAEM